MSYKIRQAKSVDNVMNSAIYHLTRMPMTINQLREKLENKTDNNEWIDDVISRLLNIGYLKSDEKFALDFSEKSFSDRKGKGYIKTQLTKKKIPESIINESITQTLNTYGFDEYVLLEQRLSEFTDFNSISYDKLRNDLTKLGFSQQMISSAIENHPLNYQLKTKAQIKGEKTDLRFAIIKLAKKGKGARLIKNELKLKFVDVSDFEVVLDDLINTGDVDFFSSALEVLSRKRYDLKNYNDKSKAYGFLSSKGFSSDEIKYALEEYK